MIKICKTNTNHGRIPIGEVGRGLSDYERNKEDNNPTHFSKTLIKEGRYKGFDEIFYYTVIKK